MTGIDLYCERLGPGLLAEPVNALTNAAFFVAASQLWRLARRQGSLDFGMGLALALVVATGIGSTLFHTFATAWARWFDELPILLFQLVFLWMYARRALGWRTVSAALLLVAFIAAALGARQFQPVLNGSITYAPAIATLLVLGLHQWLRNPGKPPLLLAAAGVFALSLALRTLDAAVCDSFPIGTHFLWHLLNALVIYLALSSMIPRS